MRHGRDHQEREQKVGAGRTRIMPEGDSFEADLQAAGRTGGAPPQHVIGATPERLASGNDLDLDQPGPVADGADVAPTRQAEQRERTRHREERKRGRMTAGTGDNLRDRREPEVTRADLDEAARIADAAVGAGPREG